MENSKKEQILLYLASRVKTTQSQLEWLRKKKRQHLLNVLFQQEMQTYYTQLLNTRFEWAHVSIKYNKFSITKYIFYYRFIMDVFGSKTFLLCPKKPLWKTLE